MNTQSPLRGLLQSADNWLLALVGVMAISFFAQTFNYRTSAAMFPRFVSVIVAALCIYQLGENIWTVLKGNRPTSKEAKAGSTAAIAWYWVALAMVVYLALIVIIGFNLATLAFMVGFPPLVGYRRWVVIGVVAIAMTVSVALSFGSILHVQLPGGWLGSVMGW